MPACHFQPLRVFSNQFKLRKSGEKVELQTIIAAITMTLAIFAIFVDRQSTSFKKILPVYIFLLIALFAVQVWEALNNYKEKEAAQIDRFTLIKTTDSQSKSVASIIQLLSQPLISQVDLLLTFGVTEERAGKPLDQLPLSYWKDQEISTANKYRFELIKSTEGSKRVGTKVWYYSKDLDSPALKDAIRELSFDVIDKKAKANQANDLTNAVWYSRDVQLDHYKLVVISLIRAGIDIQRLGPSCKNLETKVSVIEIGASDDARNNNTPRKTVDFVMNAKSFSEFQDVKCGI